MQPQVALSRHDKHNLELIMSVEPSRHPFESETDVFLFLPRSAGLKAWDPAVLRSDFRLRVRLAVPVGSDGGAEAVESALHGLRLGEGAFPDAAKIFAAAFSERVSRMAREHAERLFVLHSLLRRGLSLGRAFAEMAAGLDRAGTWLERARALLDPLKEREAVAGLLDEHLGDVFVHCLAKVRGALDRARERWAGDPEYEAAWKPLAESLDRWQRGEGLRAEARAADLCDGEQRLLRQSQLKKFFHSALVVETVAGPGARGTAETVAAAGAGLAAIWAALFQQWHATELASVGVPGAALIGSGVLAYVVKDRLKEWARHSLRRRVELACARSRVRLLADDREIGAMKEWFRAGSASCADAQTQAARGRAAVGGIEAIAEDVIHLRTAGRYRAPSARVFGRPWGIEQILRVNLARYLRHLDDPTKDLLTVSAGGVLQRTSCRRLYHFDVVVRTKYRSRAPHSAVGTAVEAYRAVVDKNGIDRVERISEL